MKLSKLVDPQFQAALRKLAGQEIPLKVAFKLKGIVKRVNEELAKYDEVRSEALNRLGDKKEDGALDVDEKGTVHLSDESRNTFITEMEELLNTEIEPGSVSVNDLGDKLSMTTAELMLLDGVVTE